MIDHCLNCKGAPRYTLLSVPFCGDACAKTCWNQLSPGVKKYLKQCNIGGKKKRAVEETAEQSAAKRQFLENVPQFLKQELPLLITALILGYLDANDLANLFIVSSELRALLRSEKLKFFWQQLVESTPRADCSIPQMWKAKGQYLRIWMDQLRRCPTQFVSDGLATLMQEFIKFEPSVATVREKLLDAIEHVYVGKYFWTDVWQFPFPEMTLVFAFPAGSVRLRSVPTNPDDHVFWYKRWVKTPHPYDVSTAKVSGPIDFSWTEQPRFPGDPYSHQFLWVENLDDTITVQLILNFPGHEPEFSRLMALQTRWAADEMQAEWDEWRLKWNWPDERTIVSGVDRNDPIRIEANEDTTLPEIIQASPYPETVE